METLLLYKQVKQLYGTNQRWHSPATLKERGKMTVINNNIDSSMKVNENGQYVIHKIFYNPYTKRNDKMIIIADKFGKLERIIHIQVDDIIKTKPRE